MTADTYSAIIGTLVMGTGNDNNSWGDNANNSIFTILEKAITGYATHAVTGGTLTLDTVTPPAGATTALEFIQNFTGTLGSNQIVQVPNLYKTWLVRNACTGSYTLTFKTSGGSASAAIPQGGWAIVWCDGSNNIYVGNSTSLRDVQWLGADGTVAAPGLSFSGEGGSGVYRKSAGVLGVSILGTEVLEISATGANVVSGTLQVAGAQVIPPGAEQAYAGIELPSGGWLWEDDTLYSRATYAALFSAITKTCTGTTHTSTTIDSLSVDLRGKGLEGAYIEGTGITTGTTIVSIAASSLVLSQAATGSASGLSLRILPFSQGDGSTTFGVPDRRYRALVGRDNMNNNPAGRSSVYAGTHLNTGNITSTGEESHTLTVAEMPSHSHTATDAGHTHTLQYEVGTSATNYQTGSSANITVGIVSNPTVTTGYASITVANTGGGGSHNNMQPFGITNWIIKT